MGPIQPYFSVVVTARNDDHGGNFLERFQVFASNLLLQLSQYHLPSELIVVEWNPPPERPSLKDAIKWPAVSDQCQVRFLEVPPEIHRRFKHSDHLALFQMIAKNAGIRRARGEYVLATNIDIVFSDELIAWIADRKLLGDRLYRADRYDVPAEVLGKELPSQRLADFFEKKVCRVNLRDGTFVLPYFVHRSKRALWSFELSLNMAIVPIHFGGWIRQFYAMKILRNWRLAMEGEKGAASKPRILRGFSRFVELLGHDLAAAFQKRFSGLMNGFKKRALRSKQKALKRKAWSKARAKRLHTNACGDFTLLSRKAWEDLKGYPELEIFSIHLDSVFCYMAHWGGMKEEILKGRKKIYHIDHFSGWSPDQVESVIRKMTEKKVPLISNERYNLWLRKMAKEKRPLDLNTGQWGLGTIALKDTALYDEHGHRKD